MPRQKSQTQCLLFLLQDKKIGSTGPVTIKKKHKGYVLLPSIIRSNESIVNLFLKNSVQPLGEELCLAMLAALLLDRVEVIELILDRGISCTKSKASMRLQISVDTTNESTVRAIFGRDAYIYKAKIDSSNKVLSAVDFKNTKIVKEILSVRANLKVRDPKVGSILHLAVSKNDMYLVKLLVAHNVNVNAKHNGTTPLHLATLNNNLPIIKCLLKKGADVDARQINGATCLCHAVKKGFFDIYKLLLENGASVNIAKLDGTTLLHAAAQSGHLEIFKDLLTRKFDIHLPVNYGSLKGCTPLFLAVEKGHIQIVKHLLELGADVNAENHEGQSVLSAACMRKCNKIVEYILSHSPKLSSESSKKVLGKLIIEEGEHLTYNGRCPIVRLLLQHGFSISAEDATCMKLLIEAIRLNYEDIVQKLLEHGAKANEIFQNRGKLNLYKTTPLVTAIKFSEERIIQLLINHGADVNLVFTEEKYSFPVSPLETAIKSSNLNAVKILVSNSVTVTSASIKHAAGTDTDCPEIMELLVQNMTEMGVTALSKAFHSAALCKNQKTMLVLLKFGADINTFFTYWHGCSKITALHLAAVKGWCDMMKLLIVNNALIDITTETNCTPLHFAAEFGQHDAVKVLLKFDARIDLLSAQDAACDMSALHYAVAESQKKIFSDLLISSVGDPDILVKTNIKKIFNFQHVMNQSEYLVNCFNQSLNSFKSCYRTLMRHIIKLQTAGFEIRDEDIETRWYLKDSYKDQYRSQGEMEIVRMKTISIANTDITFYDILRQDVKHFIGYARNDAVQQMLHSKDYVTQFPVYAPLICSKIQKGNERKDYCCDGIKFFRCLFKQFSSLPIELKEKIVSFLTNQELAILKYAFTACLPH